MATLYTNNFDSETTGTLPTGWANVGSADFKVRASDALSGSKAFGDPSYSAGEMAVYTGISAQADLIGQISQRVNLDGSNHGANLGITLRMSSDGQNGYFFLPDWATGGAQPKVFLFKRVSGSFTLLNGTDHGLTLVDGDFVWFKAEANGTTLRWKAWKNGTSEPGSWTYSTTDSSVSSAGYFGLYAGYNNLAQGSTTSSCDDVTISDNSSPTLTAGSISLTSKTDTTVNLSCTAATGGTSPYTYQWYRSTSSGFTPGAGNILSGQTSLTLADTGLTASTTYYYKVVATDSAAATATTSQLAVTTNTAAAVIAVTDSNWAFSPYNWRISGGQAISINPGAYFKAKPSGTAASLGVSVTSISGAGTAAKKYPRIRWSVDGGAWSTSQLASGNTSVTLFTGLADTTHTVLFYFLASDAYSSRWDATMALNITGVTLDAGKSLSAPTQRTGRLIAYGDSITEGAWVLGGPSDLTEYSNYEDSSASWLRWVAEALDCEYGSCAFGGQAWDSTWNSDVPSLPNAYNYYYGSNSRLSGGLLSPAPDYVLVNMGTNGGLASGTTLQTWLGNIRTAAGSSARIVVIVPFGQTGVTNITSGFNSYQSATPDSKCKLVNLGTIDGIGPSSGTATYRATDSAHPDAQGDALLGAMVVKAIEDAFATGTGVISPFAGSVIRGAAC